MIKDFIKDLNKEGGGKAENELIKSVFYSLLSSFIVLGIVYLLRLRYIEDFMPKYGIYLFLSIIGYGLIVSTIRHVRAYKEMACMSGMMIGMTIGMVSGFLSGFYIAATNGMFIGSVFGIIVGMFFGVWLGNCCGVMGFLEGIMAGFMGGLMGAMTAFMLLNDNLKVMAFIILAICGAILFGLNYMIYGETREIERKRKEDYLSTIVLSFILTVVTTLIMVFGPRSALFQ